MNHALLIAEIRYLVCIQASDHTLVQLTQCCKFFHEPAIQVLWSTIPDISLLVRCFPRDAWTLVPNSSTGDSIKLVRPLAPQDWTTFLKYSSLVRKLGMPPPSKPGDAFDGRIPRIEQRVLWELSAYRPVLVLFPNLVAFEWSGIRFPEEDLPVALGFLHPNLSKIEIHIAEAHRDPSPLRSAITLLANRFVSLKDIHLTRRPPRFESEDDLLLMPSILALVRDLPTLENFRCFYIPLTEAVFDALGSLQNLNKIAILLRDMMTWSQIKTQPAHFPKLETMTISLRSQDYIKFGTLASFPRVRSARIVLTDIPTENDLPRLVASICSQFSPSALSELVMLTQESRQMRGQLGQSGTVVRLEHLQPLFKFVNLEVFKFSMGARYALDAATYLAIAQAWPQIESFELAQGKLCLHLELPAMRDVLVPFAVHCPDLFHLGVRFDGRNTSVLADGRIENPMPKGTPSTSTVSSLDCFDSRIAEAPRVAALLALLFPDLEELTWKKSTGDMEQLLAGGSWEEVQRYLPLFATIREDGRRREALQQ